MDGWINWDGLGDDLRAAILRMSTTEREDFRQRHNEYEREEQRQRTEWDTWWSQDRPGVAKVLQRAASQALQSIPFPYAATGWDLLDELVNIEIGARYTHLHGDPELKWAIDLSLRLARHGDLWPFVALDVVALMDQVASSAPSQITGACDGWQSLDDVADDYVDRLRSDLGIGDLHITGMAVALVLREMAREAHPVLLMPKPSRIADVELIYQPLPRRKVNALDAALTAAALVATARRNPDWERIPQSLAASELLMRPWKMAVPLNPDPDPRPVPAADAVPQPLTMTAESLGVVIQGPWERGAA